MENEEIFKIAFAIIGAVLYFLFKSQSKDKKSSAPDQLNPPIAQVQIQKNVKFKTVSFEDILNKFEEQTPTKVTPPLPSAQEVNISSPAQLRKLLKEKEIKFDKDNEDITLASRKKRLKEIEAKLKAINENKDLPINHSHEEPPKHEKEEYKSLLKEVTKENVNKELIKRLKNPETAKHAFILGEIFNKKTW